MQPADPSFLSKLSSIADRASRGINETIEKAVAFLGIAMTVVVAAQVFSRYALNHSLFWSEELARYLLVWLAILGTSAAFRRNMHPGIDIVAARLSPRPAGLLRMAVLLVCLLFFAILVYYGFAFAHFVRLQITPAMQLPKWLIYSVIPFGGIVLILHTLALLMAELERLLCGIGEAVP